MPLCITVVGVPTPDPALLVEMAPPDNGSPTNLKWKFPTRAPVGVDDTKDVSLQWNYPKGQPTPDPALLTDASDKVTLTWGYPPGVPTPGKQCIDMGNAGFIVLLGVANLYCFVFSPFIFISFFARSCPTRRRGRHTRSGVGLPTWSAHSRSCSPGGRCRRYRGDMGVRS